MEFMGFIPLPFRHKASPLADRHVDLSVGPASTSSGGIASGHAANPQRNVAPCLLYGRYLSSPYAKGPGKDIWILSWARERKREGYDGDMLIMMIYGSIVVKLKPSAG